MIYPLLYENKVYRFKAEFLQERGESEKREVDLRAAALAFEKAIQALETQRALVEKVRIDKQISWL